MLKTLYISLFSLAITIFNVSSGFSSDLNGRNINSSVYLMACAEDGGDVYCGRWGRDSINELPTNCQEGSMILCKSMSLCEVALKVWVLDESDYTELAENVKSCPGMPAKPRVRLD